MKDSSTNTVDPVKKISSQSVQTTRNYCMKDSATSTKELEIKAKEAKILKQFQKKMSERQEQSKLMSQIMGEQYESDEDE